MARQVKLKSDDTTDVGWRIQQLRVRRGLRQNELAELAGLDPGYLNRLENGASRKAKPKPDTVHRILDALNVTPQERSAVFHIELPPITTEEIEATVREIEAVEEENPLPVTVIDHHWLRWYHNASMRAVLGFSPEDYRRSIGELPLHSMLNPLSPTYVRFSEDERLESFARRAQVFQCQFADQQFDSWYVTLEESIRRLPGAAEMWEDPRPTISPAFIDSDDANIYNPVVGKKLRFHHQLNRLLKDPRFIVVHLTPTDDETAGLVRELYAKPQYTYTHQEALASSPGKPPE